MKLSSLAALEIVKASASITASVENFIKKKSFLFEFPAEIDGMIIKATASLLLTAFHTTCDDKAVALTTFHLMCF